MTSVNDVPADPSYPALVTIADLPELPGRVNFERERLDVPLLGHDQVTWHRLERDPEWTVEVYTRDAPDDTGQRLGALFGEARVAVRIVDGGRVYAGSALLVGMDLDRQRDYIGHLRGAGPLHRAEPDP